MHTASESGGRHLRWPTRGISFGGDYNPEQWPEEVWQHDVELMREAGVDFATVGVFSWARLQPTPSTWDFGWLDRVLDLLHDGGVRVDLATATASPPPWLTAAHPEVRPVDERGYRYEIGSRQLGAIDQHESERLALEQHQGGVAVGDRFHACTEPLEQQLQRVAALTRASDDQHARAVRERRGLQRGRERDFAHRPN